MKSAGSSAELFRVSVFGTPVGNNPALQAIQAQQNEVRTREREKKPTESARRFQDVVDLRVAGTESESAARAVSDGDEDRGHGGATDDERNEPSDRRKPPPAPVDGSAAPPADEECPHIDLTA
ncbi:MAG: hypothetical protein KDA22_14805 [Phycisphaerales bacterium]|nr:hypothetical protein [Phycisphaerales bacterium]